MPYGYINKIDIILVNFARIYNEYDPGAFCCGLGNELAASGPLLGANIIFRTSKSIM